MALKNEWPFSGFPLHHKDQGLLSTVTSVRCTRCFRGVSASLWVLLCAWTVAAPAKPWLDPAEPALRHDIQLLSDAGVLGMPLTAWPLSWGAIGRDLEDAAPLLPARLANARSRLLQRYRAESRTQAVRPHLRAAVAYHPRPYRSFGDTSREGGELEAGIDWTGEVFAYRLQMAAVDAPDDDQAIRYDGSYVAAIAGNWAWSAGAVERWWGPGWDGSLILSNNARPIPALTVQRYYADPFDSAWLRWIGPWQFLFTLGQLESDREIPDALFLGMRLNFRPTPALEVGLSRTAQWGGEGRPEDLSTFKELLLGKDNRGSAGITAANEPGNQLGGFDVRWQSPLFDAPYAVYGQIIGEDESGGWPSKYLGMAGIEAWGARGERGASWRVHGEYADTACGFNNDQPAFGCAYRHTIYSDGYTYRGRVIGHTLGGDGRMLSLGLFYVTERGRPWEILLRRIEPHRDDPASPTLLSVELGHRLIWREQEVSLSVGALRTEQPGGTDHEGQLDAQWQWRY